MQSQTSELTPTDKQPKKDYANALKLIQVASSKDSILFAKQLTALVLSTITFSRGVFPPIAFLEKTFEGRHFKLLSGRRVCCDSFLLTKWLKSALSSLESGYMNELIFELLTATNEVFECYSIRYHYGDGGVSCNINSSDEPIGDVRSGSPTSNNVSDLLSSLLLSIQALPPLPPTYRIQLRILYEKHTPSSFTTEYFRDCDIADKKQPRNVLGGIHTPFHRLTVKIATNEPAIPAASDYEESDSQEAKKRKISKEIDNENFEEVSGNVTNKILSPNLEARRVSETGGQTKEISEDDHGAAKNDLSANLELSSDQLRKIVNCVCKSNNDRNGIFECFKCSEWHHLVCYRRKPTSNLSTSSRLACVKCAASNHDSECVDPTLVSKKISFDFVEDFAVYRQLLFKLRWFSLVSVTSLTEELNASEKQAQFVIARLLKNNLIKPGRKDGDYNIIASRLIAFITAYFR